MRAHPLGSDDDEEEGGADAGRHGRNGAAGPLLAAEGARDAPGAGASLPGAEGPADDRAENPGRRPALTGAALGLFAGLGLHDVEAGGGRGAALAGLHARDPGADPGPRLVPEGSQEVQLQGVAAEGSSSAQQPARAATQPGAPAAYVPPPAPLLPPTP